MLVLVSVSVSCIGIGMSFQACISSGIGKNLHTFISIDKTQIALNRYRYEIGKIYWYQLETSIVRWFKQTHYHFA